MADFGKTGKLTIRKNALAVEVDVNAGEHLAYKLTVKGAGPIFNWACKHKLRRNQSSFPGHPKQVYEWTWCRQNPGDADAADDVYTLELRFSSAVKYTLVVELRNSNDQAIKTVEDLDFESQTPEDFFADPLRIFRK